MQASKRAKLQPMPFQLSLRIRHPSMDPATISQELRIQPEHSFQAGQPRQSRTGIALAAVHTESYWLAALNPAAWFENLSFVEFPGLATAQSPIHPASLPLALALCAARLNKAHGALLQKIHSENGEISLLVTLSPTAVSSFSLGPEVSRTFGELGITLEFEIGDD